MATYPQPPFRNESFDRQLDAKCFSGFGLTGWSDEFRFAVSSPADKIAETIVHFYSQRSAQLVQRTPRLTFERGSGFWSVFNLGPETWPFQTITVDLQKAPDNITNVLVAYDVRAFLAFRFPPFGLKKEADLLRLAVLTGA